MMFWIQDKHPHSLNPMIFSYLNNFFNVSAPSHSIYCLYIVELKSLRCSCIVFGGRVHTVQQICHQIYLVRCHSALTGNQITMLILHTQQSVRTMLKESCFLLSMHTWLNTGFMIQHETQFLVHCFFCFFLSRHQVRAPV